MEKYMRLSESYLTLVIDAMALLRYFVPLFPKLMSLICLKIHKKNGKLGDK